MKEGIKNWVIYDVVLIKLAVLFFTLWLIGLFPSAIDFLIEWKWVFFSLMIIFAVIPFWKFCFGKNSLENKPVIKSRKKRK